MEITVAQLVPGGLVASEEGEWKKSLYTAGEHINEYNHNGKNKIDEIKKNYQKNTIQSSNATFSLCPKD